MTNNLNIIGKVFCLFTMLFLANCDVVLGEIIQIPQDMEYISQAIDSAAVNDTILVSPGIYNQNIIIRKNITLASLFLVSNDTTYIDSTVLRGNNRESVVIITGAYQPILVGLTITAGGEPEGGAISIINQAEPIVRWCKIIANRSGILCLNGSNPTIEHCRIINNESERGGDGIKCRNQSSPIIRRCLITGNSGVGLYCFNNSNPTIMNCQIDRNLSTGLYIWSSSPVIQSSSISFNEDESVGGVYINNLSNAEFINCQINNNVSNAYGGIACYNSNPIFESCQINSNQGGSVGGIRIAVNSLPTFLRCDVRRNHSIGQWGGIRCNDSSPVFEYCVISDNTSESGCAGISLSNSNAHFNRCLVYDHFSQGPGGAFFCSNSIVDIFQCTVTRNMSFDSGSAFYCEGGSNLIIRNSILWNHRSPVIFLQSQGVEEHLRPGLDIGYSNLYLGQENVEYFGLVNIIWRNGMISLNPRYVNNDYDDFRLRENSPCIDAGSPMTAFDPDWTLADMGVFFFPQANISVNTNLIRFRDMYFDRVDSLSIVIQNIGIESLNIDTILLRGHDHIYRLLNPRGSFSIEPGAQHSAWVLFDPDTTGEHRAAVFIRCNDRDSPEVVIRITGNALRISDDDVTLPGEFKILSAFPNPFNSSLKLTYFSPNRTLKRLNLFDSQGRTLIFNQQLTMLSGRHSIELDLDKFQTGQYFLQVEDDQNAHIEKIIKIK